MAPVRLLFKTDHGVARSRAPRLEARVEGETVLASGDLLPRHIAGTPSLLQTIKHGDPTSQNREPVSTLAVYSGAGRMANVMLAPSLYLDRAGLHFNNLGPPLISADIQRSHCKMSQN
jgi:hypothetical protein